MSAGLSAPVRCVLPSWAVVLMTVWSRFNRFTWRPTNTVFQKFSFIKTRWLPMIWLHDMRQRPLNTPRREMPKQFEKVREICVFIHGHVGVQIDADVSDRAIGWINIFSTDTEWDGRDVAHASTVWWPISDIRHLKLTIHRLYEHSTTVFRKL